MSSVTADLTAAIALLNKVQAALVPSLPYTAITDQAPRAKPPVVTPGPAGSIFTDPSFRSRILRVTSSPESNRAPSGALLAAWSADSSHFYTVSGYGTPHIYSFDPVNLSAVSVSTPYSQCEPTFCRTNPDLLYVAGGPIARTIQSYSIKTRTTTDILNLDALFGDLVNPRTYIGGFGNSATRLIAFFGGQGQDNHDRLIVIDLTGAAKPRVINTVSRLSCRIHGATIDLSGRYVFIFPANALPYQVIVWDLDTDLTTPVTSAPYGHGAHGYGWWVNMDSSGAQGWDAAQWQLRPLSDLTANHDLINPILLPKEVYLADHTTWNNASPTAMLPVISSTYRPVIDPTPWRAWDDEIIGISTDRSGIVYRFCHHRSDATEGFWSQPIPNVAPSGRHCLFTSNWERTLGTDPSGAVRQDVFLVEMV